MRDDLLGEEVRERQAAVLKELRPEEVHLIAKGTLVACRIGVENREGEKLEKPSRFLYTCQAFDTMRLATAYIN